MFQFVVRRLALASFTLVCVTMVVYALARAMPGDPATLVGAESLEKKVNAEDLKRVREAYGLDDPIPIGYWKWICRAVWLDFDNSFRAKKPVTEVIGERVGPTLLLSTLSLVIVMTLAVPIGVFCTGISGSWLERGIAVALYSLYSMPAYVLSLMALFLFFVLLRDTPWQLKPGMVSDEYLQLSFFQKIGDVAKHMILPLLCSSYGGLAYDARFVKANMEEQMRADYVRTARAKGAGGLSIYWRHAFRNTLVPFVTLLGLSLPGLLGGAVILEQIFAWPGMGTLMINAVSGRDYPVIMGLVTMLSILTLAGQLMADIAYAFVDPRIAYA